MLRARVEVPEEVVLAAVAVVREGEAAGHAAEAEATADKFLWIKSGNP